MIDKTKERGFGTSGSSGNRARRISGAHMAAAHHSLPVRKPWHMMPPRRSGTERGQQIGQIIRADMTFGLLAARLLTVSPRAASFEVVGRPTSRELAVEPGHSEIMARRGAALLGCPQTGSHITTDGGKPQSVNARNSLGFFRFLFLKGEHR